MRLRQAPSVVERLGTPQDLIGLERWELALLEWLQSGFLYVPHALGPDTMFPEFEGALLQIDVGENEPFVFVATA